ncbi:MAG: hypothetical protein KatS3mg060_3388 [Dehalococcoidia bacterium]|nr:MAG: hypothetical protein KatS3mg060_3388 [Dehalococcoidia bacterium]
MSRVMGICWAVVGLLEGVLVGVGVLVGPGGLVGVGDGVGVGVARETMMETVVGPAEPPVPSLAVTEKASLGSRLPPCC